MKELFTGIGVALFLTTAAAAMEGTKPPVSVETTVEDCSKQVWPHFSPACLRNSNTAIQVRLITPRR